MKRYTKSFKFKLIVVFGATMLLLIIILGLLSYYNAVDAMEKNIEELTNVNLSKTQKSIKTILESYEDLLYQIYSEDNVVELVDRINADDNLAVSRNQMRRTLRAMANVKEDIQSVTIITSSGDMIFYDKLTAATTANSWLSGNDNEVADLFQKVSDENKTVILPTCLAQNYLTRPFYLFHIGHRIVDYRNINKKNGIVVISIDANLLNTICNENMAEGTNESSNTVSFIIDDAGKIISFPDEKQLGRQILDSNETEEEKNDKLATLLKNSNIISSENLSISKSFDEELGWNFYTASDRGSMLIQLQQQRKWTVTVMVLSVIGIILIVYILSGKLTASIREIVLAMKRAENGEMSARVEVVQQFPLEMELIANQFNRMIKELQLSIDKERKAVEKQKNAEIQVLEAQINPHFLYNMLDTINWMVLDKEEYEISDTINALGHILRYGISNSTGIVTLRQELEWLQKYILLQKSRLKGNFECEVNADQEILDCSIHKLLFQPFVENAILHGFEGVKRHAVLKILILGDKDVMRINIEDNGKGMSQEMIDRFLSGEIVESKERNHIGIQNAINRLYIYYPEKAKVYIESKLNIGTCVIIEIPRS